MLVCGGDEAGRGAVIGPLVVALVVFRKDSEKKLADIGVRDSKMLSRKRREELYGEIENLAIEKKVSIITPQEINDAMKNKISLNELEAMHFSRLFDSVSSETSYLYLDSPDVIAEKFAIRVNTQTSKPTKVVGIKSKLEAGKKYTKIIAEHKADVRYPIVSAASIIAKVTRDAEVKKLEKSLRQKIGSGYPSDSKTINAILKNIGNNSFMSNTREYWKTMQRIRQTRLENFRYFSDSEKFHFRQR
ncbi:MAG: ribonuclease HII [Candidatus Micrarchaeia archaeon]